MVSQRLDVLLLQPLKSTLFQKCFILMVIKWIVDNSQWSATSMRLVIASVWLTALLSLLSRIPIIYTEIQ